MTEDEIEKQLDAHPAAIEAALLAIYERQLLDDKTHKHLRIGIRFRDEDADLCMQVVAQIRKGHRLSSAQLPIMRRKMKTYIPTIRRLMSTKSEEPMVDVIEASQEIVDSYASW